MTEMNQSIEHHYLKEGLLEDIIKRLDQQGMDLDNITRADISGVDEFHVRGAAVSKELASSIQLNGKEVLDVGCGIGGPCRMLADEYSCTTTGIDLSSEFIRTAAGLSKLVKLDNKTTFVHGDASDLPFEADSFDVVWTQHVQMNIGDKERFYSEVHRVLRPGGHFLYYDIFKKGSDEVSYPMPWASSADQSFLFESSDMDQVLRNLGFDQVNTTDQTAEGITFFEALVARLKEFGPPKIGLNVLMGESTKPKLMNLMTHLQEGKLGLQSGVYRKQ